MTKDEALDLALEALESCDFTYTFGNGGYQQFDRALVDTAITAIKQALAAQPAPVRQKPLFADIIARHPGLAEELKAMDTAPVQEPVALQMDVIVVNLVREGINKHRARELAEHFIKHISPPAAQRQWVGLTAAEQRSIEKKHIFVEDAIRLTVAKLKELNT
jgi:hypothetical protein